MKVYVRAEHGQFYAVVYGREIDRLKGRRLWFRRPALAGVGPTPGAALSDAGKLVEALEHSAALEPESAATPRAPSERINERQEDV